MQIQAQDWQHIEKTAKLATQQDLIVTGKSDDLQWLGTNLCQQLPLNHTIEVSPIYGKLVHDINSFCYQLCHSTPWGFEMGRNGNAVLDVLKGNPTNHKKCVVWMDAQYLLQQDKKLFLNLFDILKTSSAESFWDRTFILLFSDTSKQQLSKVLQHHERYNIEYINCVQTPPFNTTFCTHLSFAIGTALAKNPKLQTNGFWCDGVGSMSYYDSEDSDSYLSITNVLQRKYIETDAWLGKTGQGKYDCKIILGQKALDLYRNFKDLIDALPSTDNADWIYIDTQNHYLEIQLL